jgi:hypothetical protein
VDIKIIAAGLEGVRVRFELLPRSVTLTLQRLACGEVQSQQRGNPLVDRRDERVAPVEIACLAGPVVRDADIVGDFRRAAALVYALDQLAAGVRVQKAPEDE